jgi:hypothetical protein
MYDLTGYRVIEKKKAVALVAIGFCVGALIIWIGMGWVDAFSERMSDLVRAAPEKASAQLAKYLRIGAVLNSLLIIGVAFFASWYGFRGIRTESMPPVGSWIVEGQRVHKGPKAIMISKLMVAVSVLMALLAVAGAFILWRLAGQLQSIGGGTAV